MGTFSNNTAGQRAEGGSTSHNTNKAVLPKEVKSVG